MLSTIILFAALLGAMVLSIGLWAVFLRFGLMWAKVERPTWPRVAAAALIVIAIQIALNVLCALLPADSIGWAVLALLIALASTVLVPCLVVMRVFTTSFLKSLQAWLVTLLATVLMVVIALFIFRPFLFEAFVSPANAMAPTLLGRHWRGVCPECGRPNYCSPVEKDFAPFAPHERRMICENFHVTQTSDGGTSVLPADRFLVAKFLAPRRWDVLAFHYPAEPSTLYVMRLVGLPGEEIHIEDGAVYANGIKLDLPPSLRGIEYLGEFPEASFQLWGSKDRPAKLGADEYFVLGDFSVSANDSRVWETIGAEHSPYAVPKSHLYGVVTHIYWPMERWRSLR
jgi:signal peptidase I